MKLILIAIFCLLFTLTEAEIFKKQSFEVSGLTQCCPRQELNKLCGTPVKTRIELWDYFKVLPNTLLYSLEIENNTKYSFKWEDDKLFDVKPFLKIHVQCSDGIIVDKKYDFFETKSNIISQDLKIEYN